MINRAMTVIGALVSPPASSPFTDSRDGNVYNTVTTGTQIWMAENFRFNYVNSYPANGDPANDAVYGRLYLDAINDPSFCPVGWRIATETDWTNLLTYIGAEWGIVSTNIPKLQSATDWAGSAGTDDFGLNIKPAGRRYNSTYQGFGAYTEIILSRDPIAGLSDRFSFYPIGTGERFIIHRGLDEHPPLFQSVRLVKDVGISDPPSIGGPSAPVGYMVGSLEVPTANNDVYLFECSSSQIYRSPDGANWTPFALPTTHATGMSAQNGKVIVADNVSNGIWVSDYNVTSWSFLAFPGSYSAILNPLVSHDGTNFVIAVGYYIPASAYGYYLFFLSTLDGSSWAPGTPSLPYEYPVDFMVSNGTYVVSTIMAYSGARSIYRGTSTSAMYYCMTYTNGGVYLITSYGSGVWVVTYNNMYYAYSTSDGAPGTWYTGYSISGEYSLTKGCKTNGIYMLGASHGCYGLDPVTFAATLLSTPSAGSIVNMLNAPQLGFAMVVVSGNVSYTTVDGYSFLNYHYANPGIGFLAYVRVSVPPVYTVTGGTATAYFSVGAADSVIEVATPSYVAGTLIVHKAAGSVVEDYTVTISAATVTASTSQTIYVDAINGSNDNDGTMMHPLSSFDMARDLVMSGGTVLLYSSMYGSRAISDKPCTVKGLYGHTPILNNLEVQNGTSVIADNLAFRGGGVSAQSSLANRSGSITVRNCFFTGTSAALVDSYKYVSILQNTVLGGLVGFQLTNLQEATVSSNVIYNTSTPNAVLAVSALNVDRMDFRHNTVNAVDKVFFSDEAAIGFFKSVEVTLTDAMIIAKQIVLAGSGFLTDSLGKKAVAVVKEDGSKCVLAIDYAIVGSDTISWSGLALEPLLSTGSKLVLLYQMASGGPTPGANSGIDVLYQEVTQDVIDKKHVVLPVTNLVIDENNIPVVAVNTISGETQSYGLDFKVVGNMVTWDGMALDGRMILGDYIRVMYSYGTSLYKLDSNSLTAINSIALPTRFMASVTYNNLYSTPLAATGTNIAADPKYTDATTGNLMPLMASPNIASANPSGVGSLYNHNTSYINDKDRNNADRAFKDVTSDRGALDNLSVINTRTESTLNIGQQGFDEVYDGDASRPLRRLSRAFSDVTGDPINFLIGATTPNVSDRKMYFDDHSLELSNAAVSITPGQTAVPKILKRDTAFVQPFDPVGYIGVTAYVDMAGDDTTGDGTLAKPYRTIDKALSTAATVVIAIAGSYPLFTGVAGKKVVFVPKVASYIKGAFANSNMSEADWIVLDTSGSIPTFTPSSVYVRHP